MVDNLGGEESIEFYLEKYEYLMLKVLRIYEIKEDFDDFMQEMRLIIWKTIFIESVKSGYIEDNASEASFETYLFHALENKVIDLLREKYGFRLTKEEKSDLKENFQDVFKKSKKQMLDDSTSKLTKQHREILEISNPSYISEVSFRTLASIISEDDSVESQDLRIDISFFEETLDNTDLKIWKLKLANNSQDEIVEALKEDDIEMHRSTVSRKLNSLINDYNKFMKD